MQTKHKKNIGWLAVLTATLFILGSTTIVVSEEWTFELDGTILITGIDWDDRFTMGVDYQELVVEDNTYFWSTTPMPSIENCGYADSRNEELYVYAEPFVHTCAEEPNIGNFIECELWVEETRPGREKAYLVSATIDTWHIDYGWREGPILGWVIVWEDQYIEYQHAATYGLGKARSDDTTFIFRNNALLYIEVERGEDWIKFEFQESESAIGVWFYDLPPWIKVFDVQTERVLCSAVGVVR